MNLTNAQEQVRQFMLKAGQECPVCPCLPDISVQFLRGILIAEELDEYQNASSEDNLVEVADAIGDLLVVVLGTAVAYGINIEPVFNEIMRSNMTKFIDGYKRSDGKWIKGPSYSPANLQPLLDEQCAQHVIKTS